MRGIRQSVLKECLHMLEGYYPSYGGLKIGVKCKTRNEFHL